uniref:Transposase, YhgA-like n=1 Tax=Candidatus Kentrum sp. FM TaxID=2126340 RepID=A0A450SF39_9GAMM|nr:MAG: conserved hypothetical protein (putative transposase or invertase) [Candidatus Kentron sp. FM]VFK08990.1 MAG: conserved hypothetical protein (putative transposase or invertase) [Candidatus Kentron sp. FM]
MILPYRRQLPNSLRAKRNLVGLLYRQGWDRQRVLDLFAVLDWMMRLPEELEQQLWQDIETIEGETKMPYVTSVERLATQKGLQQGRQEGIQLGKEKGLQEGEYKKAAEVARVAMAKGMDIGVVAEISGLSEEEIRRLFAH